MDFGSLNQLLSFYCNCELFEQEIPLLAQFIERCKYEHIGNRVNQKHRMLVNNLQTAPEHKWKYPPREHCAAR